MRSGDRSCLSIKCETRAQATVEEHWPEQCGNGGAPLSAADPGSDRAPHPLRPLRAVRQNHAGRVPERGCIDEAELLHERRMMTHRTTVVARERNPKTPRAQPSPDHRCRGEAATSPRPSTARSTASFGLLALRQFLARSCPSDPLDTQCFLSLGPGTLARLLSRKPGPYL